MKVFMEDLKLRSQQLSLAETRKELADYQNKLGNPLIQHREIDFLVSNFKFVQDGQDAA